MKSIQPALLRSFTAAVSAFFWTVLVGSVGAAMIAIPIWMDSLDHPRHSPSPAMREMMTVHLAGPLATNAG